MATTTTFYTTPIMIDAVVDSATTNSADAIANLIDQNLDTSWTPAGTTNQLIVMDTQSVTTPSPLPSPPPSPTIGVSGVAIWFQNNSVDFSVATGTGLNFTVVHRDDPSQSYISTGTHNVIAQSGNLYIHTFTEAFARYWAITFAGLAGGTLPIISQIAYISTRTLNARPEFPKRDEPQFSNNVANLTGGRKRVSSQALNPQEIFNQNFTLINDTEKTTLENVYKDSQGSLLPFIYQEGTTVDEAFVCRLQQEKPDIQEIDFAYHKANMKFEQIPYILEGETL